VTGEPVVTGDDPLDARLVALLRAGLPGVIAVYRFGSTVDGTVRPDSDIDLAVLPATPLDPVKRFDVQEQLAAAVHRSIDVIDLGRASTVMASRIVTTGTLIFDGDPLARGRFEDFVYSSYARLNEERRGILERIATESSVYGR
jgi:predicted nucleotidyltransferase